MYAHTHYFAILAVSCLVGCGQTPTASNTDSKNQLSAPPSTFKIPRPASDVGLAFDVIDVIWDHGDFYSSEAAFLRSVAPATKGQLGIYAATWYISEVNNGGHYQYFFNGSGMAWQQALDGFAMLGAEEHRAVLQQAVSLFPNGRPSVDRQHRCEQLEALDSSSFDGLDEQLYDLAEDFDDLAIKYIKTHPDEFFTDP